MHALNPDITVVIPNWNGLRWLPDCLAALEGQTCRPAEVIVVDNGSTDGSLDWLRARGAALRLIALERNTGFAAAVNTGIRAAATPLVALLNTDTRAEPEWLERLRAALDGEGQP